MVGGGEHIGLLECVPIDGVVAEADAAVEAVGAAHIGELEKPAKTHRVAHLGPHHGIRRGGKRRGHSGVGIGEKRGKGAGIEIASSVDALCELAGAGGPRRLGAPEGPRRLGAPGLPG